MGGRARRASRTIGCAACHVPTLELTDTKLDAREDPDPTRPTFVIDVAKDGDGPKIEPKYGGSVTPYLVHLFSDLKRHDMGEASATPAPQGDDSGARVPHAPALGARRDGALSARRPRADRARRDRPARRRGHRGA